MKDSKSAKELYNKQFEKFSKEQADYKIIQGLRNRLYGLFGLIKGKKILFAGCGDGLECVLAIKKGAEVVGIDISEKLIQLAKRNCPEAKFYVADFERTEFKNSSFDIVVSILAVMYKKNLNSVLKEFRRILKKKGFMVLVVPHPVRKMVKYNRMNYFVKGKKWETWKGIKRFNYYRLLEDYFDCFVSSKLKVIKLIEPKPTKGNEKTLSTELNHPHFLIFKLVKD
jgi:ubiquinone/menaquinone biosynthesis C-methylase UbiE